MKDVNRLFCMAAACVLLVAGLAEAAIPEGLLKVNHYTLGDAEGGVIGNVAADPAIDSAGGVNLALTGAPVYTDGNTTPIAVDFSNALTTNWEAATEYYKDGSFDVSVFDNTNWGITLDVRVDAISGSVHSHDFFSLGSYFIPGSVFGVSTDNVIFSEMQGTYGITVGGVWYDLGVEATAGGWDHIECAIIDGIFDVEINGTPVGLNLDYTSIGGFDPGTGLVIGAAETGYTLPISRGADAAVDNVEFYGILERVSLTESDGYTEVDEQGSTSDTYTLTLRTEPSASVTIAVDPDTETQVNNSGLGNPINLTFIPAEWDTPQTVTVTAITDTEAEGTHNSVITHTASSGDSQYDGIFIRNIDVTVLDHSIILGPSRSLPVRNQQMQITVLDFNVPGATGPAQFFAEDRNGQTQLIGEETLVEPIVCQWTPTELGSHSIWCQVGVWRSPRLEVFVTTRLLHFNYWDMPVGQKWVTSSMDIPGSITGYEAKRRGIIQCTWRYGTQLPGATTEQDYIDHWVQYYPQSPGIMLDEFGGDPTNQLAGQALVMLRQQYPDIFVAPYTIGVSDPIVANGYAATDLVLLETYFNYFGQYWWFTGGYEEAISYGLGDKTVSCLGLHYYYWVTHEIELRRQFSYLRTNHPEMPGIAFFHIMTETMMDAVDRAIYDYFLGPAVLLSLDGSTVNVSNIGSLPAENVEVVFQDEQGGPDQPALIPLIDADTTNDSLTLPSGYESARLEQGPGYTVVNYIFPPDIVPDADDAAAAQAYINSIPGTETAHPFESSVVWELTYNGSYIDTASLDIDPITQGSSFAFSFDVELGNVWFYGNVGFVLAESNGTGSIGFNWRHGDADSDLPGNIPRAFMTFVNQDDLPVSEAIAPGMNASDGKQRFFVAYDDRNSSVRAMMFDKTSGNLRWDTGFIPVEGTFVPDQLRCELNASGYSTVETVFQWDDGTNRVFMESGLPPYWIQSWIDNVEVMYEIKSHGDLDDSDFVDMGDLLLFAQEWARTNCDRQNGWCGGADFDASGGVGFGDFCELADYWLTDNRP